MNYIVKVTPCPSINDLRVYKLDRKWILNSMHERKIYNIIKIHKIDFECVFIFTVKEKNKLLKDYMDHKIVNHNLDFITIK